MNKAVKKTISWANWLKFRYQNRNWNRKKILKNWLRDGGKIPPPHVVKQEVIRYFQKKYSIKILVETGTFRGEMVYTQRKIFEKIISIELSKELSEIAQKRLRRAKHIEIINGDSGKILKNITNRISQPAIFWLDAHYSGFETAKGFLVTPITSELDVILSSKINHIILIDDARMFIGENDYPTIQELKNYILSKRNNYIFNVEDDIIRSHPIWDKATL